MAKHNKQAGGTLMGLIIGLVIGLGIALVVAVTVNKTPMPFMDRSGRADKAPELTKGQGSDPNRPLYGKQDAARQAARELSREAVPAAPERAAPAVAGNAEIRIPATPPGDAPAAGGDPARTVNPEDKWTYYLQAGAFREQADAENTRAKLALQGLEASISEKPSDAGPLYRVRLGPYNQLEAMNRVRSKLSDAGMDVAVIRIAK